MGAITGRRVRVRIERHAVCAIPTQGITLPISCPFCGSGNIGQLYADEEAEYVETCFDCGAKGPPSTDCERDTARRNWDTRVG